MAGLLIQDGLVALGLIATLCLFLGVKHEMHREARRQKRALEEFAAKLGAVAQQPPEPAPTALPPPVRSGFNLDRRAQALRLLRRGEDAAHISAALDIPRREIELLIRVQDLAASVPSQKVASFP